MSSFDAPRVVLLADAASKPDFVVQGLPSDATVVLLVSDLGLKSRWEYHLDSGVRMTDIGEAVAANAESMRAEFVCALDDLGDLFDSAEWWCGRVAERNTLVSQLFLNCVSVKVALTEIAASKTTLVVTDVAAVLHDIHSNLGGLQANVQFIGGVPKAAGRSRRREVVRACRSATWFVRQWCAAILRPVVRPTVLLHTFLDAQSRSTGVYRERYLPGLSHWLELQGRPTATMTSATGSKPGAVWKSMAAQGLQPFNEFRLYRFNDLCFALRRAHAAAKWSVPDFRLGDVRAVQVLNSEIAGAILDEGTVQALIRSRLPLRMAARGVTPDSIVMEFEGMIPEKGLILGARLHLPHMEIVGFQHGTLFPLLLCNYPSPGEIRRNLIPDRVVCNGPKFSEILGELGFPRSRLCVGAALRYSYLHESRAATSDQPSNSIFIALPGTEPDIDELLTKAIAALGHSGVQVLLKAHPSTAREILMGNFGNTWPDNFHWVDSPIGNVAESCRVTLAMTSGSMLEMALQGFDVVKIRRAMGLDFDSLAWDPQLRTEVRSIEEIRVAVISGLTSQSKTFMTPTSDLLHNYFAPITDEGMRAFLPRYK